MKKIMFNDQYGLTHAVLTRKKTMTRRLISPAFDIYDDIFVDNLGVANFRWLDKSIRLFNKKNQPYYHVGDQIAIAQQYNVCFDLSVPENKAFVSSLDLQNAKGWKNKMFVKSDLMPHRIIIRNVCAQRLQSISDDDCLNEGVLKWWDGFIVPGIHEDERNGKIARHTAFTALFNTPREAFAALIDRISGLGTWERNPWTYVYQFELLK